MIKVLDRRVASGEPLDDAILMAVLLMPISRAAPPPAEPQEPGARPSVAQAIGDLLAGFVQTTRLLRRSPITAVLSRLFGRFWEAHPKCVCQ